MKTHPLFVLVLAGLLGAVGQPAMAIPITVDFSFHDYDQGADIAGVIEGLQDNGLNQAATSVIVTSNSLGYGIGSYEINSGTYNDWDVVNGSVVSALFASLGEVNVPPFVTCCTLFLVPYSSLTTVYGGLRNDPASPNADRRSVVTFIPRDTTDVPVPQTLALLVVGLAALGVNRRRRFGPVAF